ncbi:MAG: hypothetical protein K0Q68_241 [Moraxellaceae bacterium]|jgi:hypothetical protein|nr:hypothetical protein [Moraxellaceae bacterium]
MTLSHPFLPLIAETLKATGATDVLAVGALPWPEGAPAPVQLPARAALAAARQQGRADLAIARLEPGMDKVLARQLIAALRDLLARQTLVFVPENLMEDTALVGLALNRQACFEVDGMKWQAWSYDIRTYKAVPDWLNPRFWANPENWDKFRW